MTPSEQRGASYCRSTKCRKLIYWLPLKGRLHPFDDPEGKVSHFSTCVDANKFRKEKPKK